MSYAILQNHCEVKVINLRLNLFGDQGVKFLLAALEKGGTNVKSLSIPGCGITEKTYFSKMLCKNNTLEKLDISNNRIGEVSNRIYISLFIKNLKYTLNITLS